MENGITIFGTWWCGDCLRAKRFFDSRKITYTWVDIDQDKGAEEFVLSTNHGMRSVPTIIFNDGSILVEPNEAKLKEVLDRVLPQA
ncbi:MAG: glutaredoxin domain-containing protein [Acidobacteriaceae bacterium]